MTPVGAGTVRPVNPEEGRRTVWAEETDERRRPWPTVAVVATFALGTLAASLLTVWRYAAYHQQADGIMQAVMSVQDVDLFFWGQDRFLSFVRFLMSPVADPDLNFFGCLLINALSLHLVFLGASYLAAPLVMGDRDPWGVGGLFAASVAVAHLVWSPYFINVAGLETQPYSVSYVMMLASIILYRRPGLLRRGLALVLLGPVVGLSPANIIVAGALCLAIAIRTGRWRAWWVYGGVWVAWELVWILLSRRVASVPTPSSAVGGDDYMAFSWTQLSEHWGSAVSAQSMAVQLVPLLILTGLAALALIVSPAKRRRSLTIAAVAGGAFCLAFGALFAANLWVGQNAYLPRYFYPVYVLLVVALAAPAASAAARSTRRRTSGLAILTVVALVATAVRLLSGPVQSPSEALAFAATKDVADYAASRDVAFVAGSFWAAVPVQFALLRQGREAAYYTGPKSGGDGAGYVRALNRELAEPDGPPRAVCINEANEQCIAFLTAWTAPGWTATDERCPTPSLDPLVGSEPRSCTVIEFTASPAR